MLYRSDWPQTHREQPGSAFQVLVLKACTTTPQYGPSIVLMVLSSAWRSCCTFNRYTIDTNKSVAEWSLSRANRVVRTHHSSLCHYGVWHHHFNFASQLRWLRQTPLKLSESTKNTTLFLIPEARPDKILWSFILTHIIYRLWEKLKDAGMNSVLREGCLGASFFCKYEWVGLTTIEQLPESAGTLLCITKITYFNVLLN